MLEFAERVAALPSASALSPDEATLLLWTRGTIRVALGRAEEARPLLEALVPAARSTGQDRLVAAAHGLGLVYGGGSVGLMGVVADAVLAGGGEVIGIIPRALASREIAHGRLPDLRVVSTMHERKAQMADLADAFIALPGGLGTFDELFEILTWSQLGLHLKPVGLLNADDYFAPLLALIAHATTEGFVPSRDSDLMVTADDPDRLIEQRRCRSEEALMRAPRLAGSEFDSERADLPCAGQRLSGWKEGPVKHLPSSSISTRVARSIC